MAIVVRHDQPQTALDALAALWIQKQQQAAAEQGPALTNSRDAILQAVAPALQQRISGRQPIAPGQEPQPTYRPDGMAQSYRRFSDGGGGDYSGANSINRSLLGGEIQSALTDQRYQNQDALAQERYQQQAQLQNDRLAHQLQEQSIREADMMGRQATQDLPDWILKGQADGSLAWTPMQMRDRAEHSHAIDVLRTSDQFTPEQKERAIAEHQYAIRQIDLNPHEVPPNERPQSPQEQAQQISWEETDPTSGLTVRKYLGSRNGTPQPELDPVSKAHLDDWADERKYQRQLQLKQFELAHKPDDSGKEAARVRSEQMRLQRYKDTKIRDYNKAVDEYKKAMDDLTTLNTYSGGMFNQKVGKAYDAHGYEITSEDAKRSADRALAEINRLQQDISDIDRQTSELHAHDVSTMGGAGPWQTFDGAVQNPASPDLSQAAPIGAMDDAVFRGDPNAPENQPQPIPNYDPSQPAQYRLLNGRVVVDSDEEARALNLEPGTPVITSQGRTAIWQP